ncbi:hypothetical protein Nepgr_014479 [Nepenthes gracilis]|uniref:RING-type E3 ubiquitin transferase n=1 Tax=Nepenthes gracilis TaxID=150966 RepID=A0AAD3SK38_NEPGR|nr:hypothetical protein Nepgr_014479 [Nepenthes gracilis]
MMTHSRKLLPPEDDPTIFTQKPIYAGSPVSSFDVSSNTSPASSASPTANIKMASSHNPNSNISGIYDYQLSPPFDSIALTVLVLLIVLFFMGFFSIYIHRFADETSVDPTSRRRRGSGPEASTSSYPPGTGTAFQGADPSFLRPLPVHAYDAGAKQGMMEMESDCAICLSEFEEGQYVKVIPFCRHVFHMSCIDAWLSSQVTCPLCRTDQFFPTAEDKMENEWGVAQVQGNVDSGASDLSLSVDGRETCSDLPPPVVLRRSSSSSCLGDRVILQRSMSF